MKKRPDSFGDALADAWLREWKVMAEMPDELRRRMQREQLVDLFREEEYEKQVRRTGKEAPSRQMQPHRPPATPAPKRGLDR